MTGSFIAKCEHDRRSQRLIVSVDLAPGDTLRALLTDGQRAPGEFVASPFGWLYRHTDGVYGLPNLGFGSWQVTVRKTRDGKTTNMSATAQVLDPPSTLGTARIWPPENVLPYLWDAGFRAEDDLLLGLAIACGEGGCFERARNWLPSGGFRPAGTAIGVQGPAAAWDKTHLRQGHSDRGIFQFNSHWFAHIPDEDCDDVERACRAMFAHVQKQGWGSWGWGSPMTWYAPFFDASYKSFPPLRGLVKTFLANK